MPTNIEFKARARDLDACETRIRPHADHGPEVLDQTDIFFGCDNGRLKLRTTPEGPGELIHYHRNDTAEARASHYHIARTDTPDQLTEVLRRSWGVIGTVRKTRRLYRVGQSRIHLDRVDGLGDFVEVEVVLRDGQSASDGQAVAAALRRILGVRATDIVARAYIDLLAAAVST